MERFDTEPETPIWSAKSSNFRRLVLRCIGTKFCNSILALIFQHFSRSTRLSHLRTFGIPSGKKPGKTTRKIPLKIQHITKIRTAPGERTARRNGAAEKPGKQTRTRSDAGIEQRDHEAIIGRRLHPRRQRRLPVHV